MFELKNVTKSYLTPKGRRYVFRNLSLSIPPDKNIGLIGRNGAGKSTLMRLLGGADIPDSGTIVTDQSISWPVGLSGGFQGSMTGRDNIKFVCRVYGAEGEAMREKVRYVQEFAEIGDWIDEPIKTYSSGMRSRVAFGLSMAGTNRSSAPTRTPQPPPRRRKPPMEKRSWGTSAERFHCARQPPM